MKKIDLKEATRALAQENRSAHPSAEELLSYHRSELADEASNKLKEHLASCRSCVAVLLTLADQKHEASDAALQKAWQAFQDKTAIEEPPPQAVLPHWQLHRRPLFAGLALLVILAAGALFFLSSQAQMSELERRVAELDRLIVELTEPELDLSIIDLYPRGFARQEREEGSLARDHDLLAINLNLASHETYEDYALEIRSQDGEVIWKRRGLRRTPAGFFHLALRTTSLAAGSYELEAYGLRGDEEVLLASYVLRLADGLSPDDPQ